MIAALAACLLLPQESPLHLIYYDDYVDGRARSEETLELFVKEVEAAELSMEEFEAFARDLHFRGGNFEEELVGKVTREALPSLHADVVGELLLYVPESASRSASGIEERNPLVIVGHGGNSSMSADYGRRAAMGMLNAWKGAADEHGFVLAAPVTRYGWGPTGYSLVLSAIEQVSAEIPIDRDRVHLTGHSMGGHLTYRAALTMADRFASVAPMSGGYDYVEKGSIQRLWNVPGIATWATSEPYGIGEDNERMRDWMVERDFPWRHLVGEGHHTIFPGHVKTIAKMFAETSRDLYRKDVYAAAGGRMVYDTPWKIEREIPLPRWREGAGIPIGTTHWVRQYPREVPEGEKAPRQAVRARIEGQTIDVRSSGARRLTLYLHPRMLSLDEPVTVVVNGEVAYEGKPARDWRLMLRHMGEYRDPLRFFHAAIDLEITTDAVVPVPGETAPAGEDEDR